MSDVVLTSVLRNIFTVNLGVSKDERVLVFNDRVADTEQITDADRERRSRLGYLSLITADTGKSLCKAVVTFEYPATGSHGTEPPPELWSLAFGQKTVKALKKERLFSLILNKKVQDKDMKLAEGIIRKYKKDAVDCVIALANYSTSHTRFRDFLTRICGCRYASMPVFDISMLEGPMNVNWKELAKKTKEIARQLQPAESVRVKAQNGTDISFSKKSRRARVDTGILTRPGSFSNLPAGEVYLAPVEGTAHGRLVLEWAPTQQLESPVTLTVENGHVAAVSGNAEYAAYLRAKLGERRENGNIAEFGIGTNTAARRPDNILESEKIFGTIHIALGDNSSFGGNVKTPFHEDFVFFKPTVTLIQRDGTKEELLKAGKLIGWAIEKSKNFKNSVK